MRTQHCSVTMSLVLAKQSDRTAPGVEESAYKVTGSFLVPVKTQRLRGGDGVGGLMWVYQLLTDLKEQRRESGKNKHSAGQQNLNAITYETLKYISKTPCRNQSPEIVQEFLTAMKSHKLTKGFTHYFA
ncbi:hypothetical protein STEG23_018195 [Scotinomys teguina]